MWGRVIEIMTAVWIGLSPFIFRATNDPAIVWADNLIALSIIVLASLSLRQPTRHAHLLILGVALGMIAWGRLSSTPPLPVDQNHIFVGLFLLMIAIVPNNAMRPPDVWRTSVKSFEET